MKKILVGISGMILAISLGACGNETFEDAPVKERNTVPADLINFPDHYSNVASKCDGPNRVYVIYHADNNYGSVAVAANDPRCVAIPVADRE